MKNFFRFFLMSLLLAMSISAVSCSDDDDEPATPDDSIVDIPDDSIVGTWEQTNSYGTVITVQFKSNKTGVINFVYSDGSGSSTENFEYDYQPEKRYLEIIGSQLDGKYEVTLTATKLRLTDYSGYYEFTRR